jgi:carboxylesterase type B
MCARGFRNSDGVKLGTSNTEDCLYLSVFTQVGYARKHSGRPVMVWIYGDGLIAGEDNDYYTSKLVTQGDVIVVKFNYLWILRSTVN